MKTRSYFVGKVFCLFLLAVLTLCICTPVLAASNTTSLTTTVPSHIDINVTIVGSGTVEINGRKLSETCTVPVERNQEVTIKLTPSNGYHIHSVTCDGADITQKAESGCFPLPKLEYKTSIVVNFAIDADNPNTRDNSSPLLVFFSITTIVSLWGIVLLIENRKKFNCK